MDQQSNDRSENDSTAPEPVGEGPALVLESIIPYQANRLTYRMNQLLNKDLRARGLNISKWRVMAVLDYNDRVSVNDLADYAMIEQSTLSRLLARMEEQGYLTKKAGATDGRVRSISLTAQGRAKYDEVRALTLAHTARALEGLSRSEKTVLTRTIERMHANLTNPDISRYMKP